MTENRGYNGTHMLLAFLAGAAAGAAAGLLLAPKPGRETLEAVRGWTRDVASKAARAASRAAEAAKEVLSEALASDRPEAPPAAGA